MKRRAEITGLGMLLMLALALPPIAAFDITITAPDFAREGDSVNVSVAASEPGQYSYVLLIDDEPASIGTAYLWHTNYADAGQHTLTFIVNDSDQTVNRSKTIYLQDVPLTVGFQEPAGTYTAIMVPVRITTSYPPDVCTYQYSDQEGIMAGSGTTWTAIVYSAEDGPQEMGIYCTSAWDEIYTSASFTVDTTSPSILETSPSGTIQGDFTQLRVDTDEPAWCRYGLINEPYADLDEGFATNGTTANTVTVWDLIQGTHIYFVRCADQYGHANDASTTIAFSTNLEPTATVDVDQSPPLSEGLYTVTLHTSEPVTNPELTYNYQDGSGGTEIAITGSGSTWSGYLQVPADAGEKILVFSFSATDETGLEGTEITDGKIVLIDTIAPGAPLGLMAQQEEAIVTLDWEPASDDYDFFKIYESETPGVSTNSNNFAVSGTSWSTSSFLDGQTRAYRVSAVDAAGNEGPLSSEVMITFQDILDAQESGATGVPLSFQANPGLLFDINQTLTSIDIILLQAEHAMETLESLDEQTLAALDPLDILATARGRVDDIRMARMNSAGLANQPLEEEDARKTLKRNLASAETAFREMPRNARLETRTEYEQLLEAPDIERAAREYAAFHDLADIEQFVRDAPATQDGLRVIGTLMHLRVLYAQGSEEYTIVQKDVLVQDFTGDIVEYLPKALAQSTDAVTFALAPTIINRDPVVSWRHQALPEGRILYWLEGLQDLSVAQSTKTVAMLPLPEQETLPDTVPAITGAVTGAGSGFMWELLVVLGGIIVVGLAAYYFFALKAENTIEARAAGETISPQPARPEGDIILSGHLTSILDKAHVAADASNTEEAYRLSLDVLRAQAQLPYDERRHTTATLAALKTKLALHTAVKACHAALDQGDQDALLRRMQYLRSLLHEMDTESPLFSWASDAYRYFCAAQR